jgi:hypothetical protein
MAEALRPAYNDSAANLITVEEALARRNEGWPVLLWLRDPFEKFASAFAIFGKGRLTSMGLQRRSLIGTFADKAMVQDDAHWAPQTRTHRHGGVFLPTKVMPFSDIAATWAAELPGYTLGHVNQTRVRRATFVDLAVDMSADLLARLETHFKSDTDMLEAL